MRTFVISATSPEIDIRIALEPLKLRASLRDGRGQKDDSHRYALREQMAYEL
jgi:hypothetical protein